MNEIKKHKHRMWSVFQLHKLHHPVYNQWRLILSCSHELKVRFMMWTVGTICGSWKTSVPNRLPFDVAIPVTGLSWLSSVYFLLFRSAGGCQLQCPPPKCPLWDPPFRACDPEIPFSGDLKSDSANFQQLYPSDIVTIFFGGGRRIPPYFIDIFKRAFLLLFWQSASLRWLIVNSSPSKQWNWMYQNMTQKWSQSLHKPRWGVEISAPSTWHTKPCSLLGGCERSSALVFITIIIIVVIIIGGAEAQHYRHYRA